MYNAYLVPRTNRIPVFKISSAFKPKNIEITQQNGNCTTVQRGREYIPLKAAHQSC
jgi:hypothetical protein